MLFQPSMHWVVSYSRESTRTLTKMTTRDSLKECTRSRTGRLSLERWRVKFRTMRMEEAPPIRVQVKNVLGASAVRSCAAGGACGGVLGAGRGDGGEAGGTSLKPSSLASSQLTASSTWAKQAP